jgi:hypothetical protein
MRELAHSGVPSWINTPTWRDRLNGIVSDLLLTRWLDEGTFGSIPSRALRSS